MINNPVSLPQKNPMKQVNAGYQKPEIKDVGKDFELLFAKNLVAEMTKNQFQMGGKDSFMSAGSELYKHHITDTLSKELANQGSLGIAELIQKYKK